MRARDIIDRPVTASFMLVFLLSIINAASIGLTVFGLMSGLRLSAEQEVNPYDTQTTWRYGLGAVIPTFTLVVTLLYSMRSRSGLLRDFHLVWTVVGTAFLAYVSGYEIYVYSQCNDFTASSTPDHPQCQNRNYPINSHPDDSWILMAVGIWVSTALGIYWIFYNFSVRWSVGATLYRQKAAEQILDQDEVSSKINNQIYAQVPTHFINRSGEVEVQPGSHGSLFEA